MAAARGEFSSRIGFVLAASGSAVGLGNIWGFPTQAASNGGGAFLVVYLILTFLLAYPTLMAEFLIGRYAKANAVPALRKVTGSLAPLGALTGYAGILTACLLLSFYAVIAGFMIVFFVATLLEAIGQNDLSEYLTARGTGVQVAFTAVFMLMTIAVICGGIKGGIERWSTRLMPSLFVLMFVLIAWVLTLDGATEGLSRYLVPDFAASLNPDLLLSAMGQSFFSLSIGVGTMLIYGSYCSKKANLVRLGMAVTVIDVGVAFLAGLLILPAMYVAATNGVQIFDESDALVSGPGMIFSVLPALFDTLGTAGLAVGGLFFLLMTIAALTSSISLLEVPVAYAVEEHGSRRVPATLAIGAAIFLASLALIIGGEWLFDLAVAVATEYSQPVLALLLCVFAGWVWRRDQILGELREGNPEIENSLFWKIWPLYVKFICPVGILTVFYNSLT
ncbi:MAG: sodium-dependent transporter [Pseudomonadota bacterium]